MNEGTKNWKDIKRTLIIVIILSAINSAVGYGLIMTFDFLEMFLMIPLLFPFTLGCSILGFMIIIEYVSKNIKKPLTKE